MAGYYYFYQKISSWSAIYTRLTFFTDSYTLTVINSGRNADLNLLLAGNVSGSTTVRTFVTNNFTASVTYRTGLYILYHTK